MKRIFEILMILCLVTAVSFTVSAQQGKQKKGSPMLKKLNLTDEQKDKVHGLSEKHQRTMIDLKADLEKAELDKKEIIRKGAIDRKSFLEAESKISSMKAKLDAERAGHQMDIYSLLNTEQKLLAGKKGGLFVNHPPEGGPRCVAQGMHKGGTKREPCQGEKSKKG